MYKFSSLVDTIFIKKGDSSSMKSLCIKTNNTHLLEYLLNELKYIEIKNVCFTFKTFRHYKNVIIHYSGKDYSGFCSTISTILAFLVIDELEEDFLKRIITQNYFYFDSNERTQILNLCYDLLAEDFSDLFNKKFNTLYNNFLLYISSHKSIILKGVLNFRMQKYWKILNEVVDEAVNAFIIEKEYLEFISLLKLYINSQASLCNVVHIIYSSSESILLDENKNIIKYDNSIFDAKYLSDITFSSNDFTLNTLLNLLPKKIYIHLLEDYSDEFINTLEAIFEDRIDICRDCNICKIYKNQKHFLFNRKQ